MRGRMVRLMAVLGLAVAAAGCGSDGADTSPSPTTGGTALAEGEAGGTATGGTAAGGTAVTEAPSCEPVGNSRLADTKVDVALDEWTIEPSRASVPAGSVHFELTNRGQEPHELVVIRTDLDPARLPTGSGGEAEEDELPEGAVIGEVEPFPGGGETCRGTFALQAGSYALICNVLETEADGTRESHYAEGMRTKLTVT